jgi:hypothetical protein
MHHITNSMVPSRVSVSSNSVKTPVPARNVALGQSVQGRSAQRTKA